MAASSERIVSQHRRWMTLVGMVVIVPTMLHAADRAGVSGDVKPGVEKPATPRVAELIALLNSPMYQSRTEASRRLHKLGQAAIEPIAQAAETSDLEIAARCVAILQSFYDSSDPATKSAAERALKKLAKSRHASVANRAANAIRKPAPVSVPTPARFGNRVIIFNGGNRGIQIQGQILRRLVNRAPVRQVGGRQISREVTAKENGRTIHIKETLAPKREVLVKITEQVAGKDKTTEYKARTSAELRRLQPKAYKLYKKHIGKARMQVQNINIAIPAVPALPVQRAAANPPPAVKPAPPQGLIPPPAINPPVPGAPGFGRGNRISIRSSIRNGQQTVDVTDGPRTIHITDSNGNDITVTITDTVGGKQQTSRHQAKDLAELKKKNAEAAKLYEKYAKSGNARLQMIRNRFGIGRAGNLPNLPPGGRFGRAGGGIGVAQNQMAKKEIEKANERLAKAIAGLKKIAADKNAKPEELKKIAEEIQFARDGLERAYSAIK